MAEQKLIISATTPDGLDASKTISNINPDASNEQLAALGQKLTAFTDNTYGKTDRVIKYNCDTESGGNKQTPNLSLAQTSVSITDLTNGINGGDIAISTNSDGVLYIQQLEAGGLYAQACIQKYAEDTSTWYLKLTKVVDGGGNTRTNPQTLTIYQAETDTYQAAEATFTVTA